VPRYQKYSTYLIARSPNVSSIFVAIAGQILTTVLLPYRQKAGNDGNSGDTH
jgi:hypothetical protein